jgi:hypothetical protein
MRRIFKQLEVILNLIREKMVFFNGIDGIIDKIDCFWFKMPELNEKMDCLSPLFVGMVSLPLDYPIYYLIS